MPSISRKAIGALPLIVFSALLCECSGGAGVGQTPASVPVRALGTGASPSPSPSATTGVPVVTPSPAASVAGPPIATPTATAKPSAVPTTTATPTAIPSAGAALVPQGLYESCGMIWVPQTCLADLDTFEAAGFTRVINYSELQSSAADFVRYLSYAARDGIGVVVSLNSVYDASNIAANYPDLARTCPSPCTTPPQFAAYVAGLAKSNPGTWGYYIGDETQPSPLAEAQTAAVYAAIKAVDPNHPTLFVGSSGFNTDLATLTNLIGPFLPDADVIGADHYSIGAAGDQTGASQLPFSQAVRTLATAAGKPSTLVLQAFGFDEYGIPYCSPYPSCDAFPTEAQMQTLYQNAVLGDPNVSMIFWYSYMDIERSPAPAANFANLRTAIRNR